MLFPAIATFSVNPEKSRANAPVPIVFPVRAVSNPVVKAFAPFAPRFNISVLKVAPSNAFADIPFANPAENAFPVWIPAVVAPV